MKTSIFCAFLVVFGCAQVSAKIFTKCELAHELQQQGFPNDLLPNWVCLIENGSRCNTAAKRKRGNDGSCDWGLFHINDKNWCSPGKPGKGCNMKCEDFLLDDITKACKCAKKVYARHKFNAWPGYKSKCEGNLPDLTSCELECEED